MDFWFELDAIYGIIYSGFKTALNIVNTVCIQMPKRALVLYITVQKVLLLLPFRVLNKLYDTLVKLPVMILLGIYRIFFKEDPAPVELLTGQRNPTPEQIMTSIADLRKSTLKTIRRETRVRTQLDMHRRQLENWKMETEKKTEEIFKLSIEERDLLKATASALRYLRSLKIKREKINDGFSDNIKTMLEDGTVTADKLLAMQKKIKTIDAAIKEKKDACLDLLGHRNITNFIDPMKTKKPLSSRQQTDNIIFAELVHKALALMADENCYLKEKLCSSQSTLDRILEIMGNIHDKVYALSDKLPTMTHLNMEMKDLQKSLETEKMLLMAAEADRDVMKEKLATLECMINEEESYLSDVNMESAFDSDFQELSTVE